MAKKGTALNSLKKRENLHKGYPLKDPKTGKVTVSRKQPKTSSGGSRSKTKPGKAIPSQRDSDTIQERLRVERALGINRKGRN